MFHTIVEIIQRGEGLGIELPEEVLRQLNVGVGDEVQITDSPDGIRLSRVNPKATAAAKVSDQVMADNREVVKRLADS